MKIITLKQPWASLVAYGIKKYEFRTWKTNYRGKLLIHAGAGIDKDEMKKYVDLGIDFPKSKIIAIVDLVDCCLLDDELNKKIILENNIAYGNKIRTGYAWKLDNVKMINIDEKINGQLGLWNYDYEED